jgi:Uma2 family endonuclease
MVLTGIETKTYTVDEYLDLEVTSDRRHEYRCGAIVEMTGGTPAHNEIIRALTVILSLALRGQPYQVFLVDQRLWLPESNLYTYPDAMIVPRPIELQAGRKDTITNPVVVAEVLSDSTATYDRGKKFAAYQTLPTLQEYLLIDQSQPRVEQFAKQSNNQWQLRTYDGLESRVALTTVAIEIILAELYENISFTMSDSEG